MGCIFYCKLCCNTHVEQPQDTFVEEVKVKQPVLVPAEDLEALKNEINNSPLVLHFDFNKAEMKSLTDEELEKVAKIKTYLEKVSDAKIICVGHTDNVGSAASNFQFGQKRADFTKTFLIKNGIDVNKIITSSRGLNEPIADNVTNDGKAKNRRVVITVL